MESFLKDNLEDSLKNTQNESNAHVEFRKYSLSTKNNVLILRNMSFSLPKGKMTALLGLSGDGKSTTMDRIAGLCNPSHKTAGDILVDVGAGLEKRKDVAKWFSRITYCQQESIDYRKLTAIQIISSVAEVNNVPLKEAKELLSRFSIEKNKNVSFKNLSGGQKRRVLVICALLENKDLCIYDEPISGLDSSLAMLVLHTIKKTEKTSLISVHQPSPEIVSLFDHIIVMYNGTAIYSGACSDVIGFFAQHNVNLVKENYFYLTYMVHLFGSDNHTEEDLKNKRSLDLFTESIMTQEISSYDSSQRNLFLVPITNTIVGKEAFSIIKTSFLFDKGFFGKPIIIELFGICIWLAIFCFLYKDGVASAPKMLSNYTLPDWSIFLSDAGKTKLTNLLTAKGAEYSGYYTQYLNILLLNKTFFAMLLFMIVLVYILLVGDTYVSSNEYHVSLKKNIQKNSNTPLAYILALCVEVVLRKVFLLLLFQIIFFFYIVKFTNDSWLYKNSTISCLPLIVGMYFFSLISGLIYICFQMLSINRKLKAFLIGMLFALFLDSVFFDYIGDSHYKIICSLELYSETIIYAHDCSAFFKDFVTSNLITFPVIKYFIDTLLKAGTLVKKFQFMFIPHTMMYMYGLRQKTIPYEIDSTLNYLPVASKYLENAHLDIDKHTANQKISASVNFFRMALICCNSTNSFIRKDSTNIYTSRLSDGLMIILKLKYPNSYNTLLGLPDTTPLPPINRSQEQTTLNNIVEDNISDPKERERYYRVCNTIVDNAVNGITITAHSYPFDGNSSIIKSISILDIIWTPMKFLLPLIALFLLVCFFKYRAIQPKLRC
ncbi:hypothetical protein NEFER03_0497 [Nematocida sp. LUAm3]|nr:hypothetical protein NEFER03_0497 [Nematocida sp. LUAm3]